MEAGCEHQLTIKAKKPVEQIKVSEDLGQVLVLCDGTTYPFTPHDHWSTMEKTVQEVSDWGAYARRRPDVRFHFCALGSGADKKT
jgi:hypothetical protein